MRKIITLLLFCGAYCGLMAQSEAETKAQINKIKRSQSYLSAEATMPTEEEAIQQAKELLVSEINDWVAGKRKGGEVKQVVLQDINTCTQRMDMKRGVRTRAFVYVKKNEIVLIYGEGQIMLSEEEKGADLQPLSEISEPIKIEPVKKSSKDEKMVSTVEKINPEQESLNQILAAQNMMDMKQIFAAQRAGQNLVWSICSGHCGRAMLPAILYPHGRSERSGEEKRQRTEQCPDERSYGHSDFQRLWSLLVHSKVTNISRKRRR